MPRPPRDRGAAAVEFALVALLLVTLLMGILEFGRLFSIQASLAQASRDAARTMAVRDDTGEASAQFYATFSPLGGDPDAATVSISREGTPGTPGCREVVEGSYVATSVTGFFGGSFTLGAQGAMRCNG
ncbi:TadE/TadG family type IV pilus assembly protein [Ornithinimicrobium sp. LYQ92]|uniref:TadE/TadG family type IV pilus assembly protein n=1 Tax=Serinicoccus sp. LYQ92 TaxID=3378798 RepID=UPI0038539B3E